MRPGRYYVLAGTASLERKMPCGILEQIGYHVMEIIHEQGECLRAQEKLTLCIIHHNVTEIDMQVKGVIANAAKSILCAKR